MANYIKNTLMTLVIVGTGLLTGCTFNYKPTNNNKDSNNETEVNIDNHSKYKDRSEHNYKDKSTHSYKDKSTHRYKDNSKHKYHSSIENESNGTENTGKYHKNDNNGARNHQKQAQNTNNEHNSNQIPSNSDNLENKVLDELKTELTTTQKELKKLKQDYEQKNGVDNQYNGNYNNQETANYQVIEVVPQRTTMIVANIGIRPYPYGMSYGRQNRRHNHGFVGSNSKPQGSQGTYYGHRGK